MLASRGSCATEGSGSGLGMRGSSAAPLVTSEVGDVLLLSGSVHGVLFLSEGCARVVRVLGILCLVERLLSWRELLM